MDASWMDLAWMIATVGGPIVLGSAIAYALLRNRQRRRHTGTSEAHRPEHSFPHSKESGSPQ